MSAGPRPYVLADATWKSIKETAYQVAILPWGATEAHNYHLPYGTDVVLANYVAVEAARRAWERNAKVVVLPCIPFGVNTGQLDIRLTINMNPTTQTAVLNDIAASLAGQGIPKLVIVNGHGGNDFRQIIRELQPRHRALFMCCVDWYQVVDPDPHFLAGDHAGEMETSVMLHAAPELVLPLSEAGTGTAWTFKLQALREKWAWAPREWTRVTGDTGIGDPRGATAAKGAEYAERVIERVAGFLIELAAADPDDLYEERPTGGQ
jgi:creatinine amidohydrolase